MQNTQKTSNSKKDYDLEHMPKFIKDAPWYLANGQSNQPEEAVLFHQRIETDKSKKESIHNWYQKGYRKASVAVTKFRKGACANCGAISHKTKDCLERPRKVGAKWTQRDIAKDEFDTSKQQVNLTYESKRDRWNGYNPDVYKEQVINEWELKDQLAKEQKAKLKNEAKQKRIKEKKENGDDVYSSDSDDNKSSDSREDANTAPGTQNLRTREDTAKYLRNLDPNSAPYDPKSRSMKANPNPHLAEKDQEFKGDNFVKLSGDYLNLIKNEGFMLDINKKAQATGSGLVTNMIGMPSQFEMLQKEFKKRKEQITSDKMKQIQAAYGNQEEHLQMPQEIQEQLQDQYEQQQLDILDQQLQKQRELIEGKREINVNHDESQSAIITKRGADFSDNGLTGAVRSKYEQPFGTKNSNGHSMAWGSFWHQSAGWGFKCCFSFDKNSKCLGPSAKSENLKKAYIKSKQENKKKRQRPSQEDSSPESKTSNKRQKKLGSDTS